MATIDWRPGGMVAHGGWTEARASVWRRAGLAVVVLAAMAAALWLGRPQPALVADLELARVLRGMAVLKASIATAVVAALWWRAARPIPARRFALAALGAAVLAAAAVLVWQLAVVLPTSLAFHATLLLLGFLALGDDALGARLPGRRGR